MPRFSHADYQRLLAQQKPKAAANPATGCEVEADLHQDIKDECQRRLWIALHGSTAHRTHRTVGEPDFVILADNGRVLFIECKTKTGKVSTEQAALHAWAAKLGHTVHIVRSFEEFLGLCDTTNN